MIDLPILPSLTEAEKTTLELWAKSYQQGVLDSLKPPADAFGMRQLPREPGNPNKFLPTFKTDKHTYTIIGENGLGFKRYTVFQQRMLQRSFGMSFQQIWDELQKIKLGIGGENHVGKMRSDAIINITGLQDSVVSFGKEQFEAALWMCTVCVLREDETVADYSEIIGEEKIKDWGDYGFCELDFFFLSGNLVPGYGTAFKEALANNERNRQKFMDAIATNGRSLKEDKADLKK